jgi:large subunit ribosomal protein L36e
MKTGISCGLEKGYKTDTIQKKTIVNQKGTLRKRTKFVRDLVREVVGFAPYEKRVMELLKNSKDKKAKKLAKKRLGTLKRAKVKIDDLSAVIQESRMK